MTFKITFCFFIVESAYKTVSLLGQSKHQTVLALDFALIINNIYVDNFDDSFKDVEWIHENAYKYGFILSHLKSKKDITGFSYEYWHLRYIGKEVSYYMHNENISTLEEYKFRLENLITPPII